MLSFSEIKVLQKEIKNGDDSMVRVFDAMSDPGCFKMFKLLTSKRELCVTDFAEVFNISLPAASVQLKILEISGLVKRERMGQMICYSLNKDNPAVKSLVRIVKPGLNERLRHLVFGEV